MQLVHRMRSRLTFGTVKSIFVIFLVSVAALSSTGAVRRVSFTRSKFVDT